MKQMLFFIIILLLSYTYLYSNEEYILANIIKNSYDKNELKEILFSSLDFPVSKKHKHNPGTQKQELKQKISTETISKIKKEIEINSKKTITNRKTNALSKIILDRIKRYNNIIKRKSKKYNLDENFVKAIIYVESAGKKKAVSRKGAMGLMQIMPSTAATLGLKNPFNPTENIETGCKLLSLLKKFYQDDDFYVLWAYNAGINRVDKNILPNETRNYIINIKRVQNLLKKG